MAWDDRFLRLMPRTVTFRPILSRDRYGAATYGAGSESRAKVADGVTENVDVNGEVRETSGTIWVPPETSQYGPDIPPSTDQAVVLHTGLTAKVVKVEAVDDHEGLHHYKVWYG